MNMFEPLYTTEDVAKYLKVDEVTIRRLVSRGELAAYSVAGEYRFSERDVQEYLQQHRVEDAVNAPSNEAGSEAWQTYVSRYQLNKLTHQALQFAREEAQTFQHPYIGPEHLLLGVLRVSEGTAAQVLNALGVQLESARNGVRLVVGHGECEADQALDLTIPTKKMITDAQQEARHRNYPSIGTEHLLLSLVRTGEGVIPQVLESMGVSVEMVRARVLHYPGPLGPPPLRRS